MTHGILPLQRAHGVTRYQKGPDEHGRAGLGCRCPVCRGASSTAQRDRRRRAAYGRPLERPVRAARPRPDSTDMARIDACGTHRRIQALVAVGYPLSELGRHLGWEPTRMTRFMRRAKVHAATADRVRELYDDLWDVPPDESTWQARRIVAFARAMASRHGWAPPAAWDDDEIDDPQATPATGWRRPKQRSSADLAAEYADLSRWYTDRDLIAERLGVTRAALDKAISRTAQRAS